MVALRGLTPDLLRFLYDLLGAADWVLLPAMEGNPAIVSSPGLSSGFADRFPEVVCGSPEELGTILSGGFDAWRAYRDRIVGDGQWPAHRGTGDGWRSGPQNWSHSTTMTTPPIFGPPRTVGSSFSPAVRPGLGDDPAGSLRPVPVRPGRPPDGNPDRGHGDSGRHGRGTGGALRDEMLASFGDSPRANLGRPIPDRAARGRFGFIPQPPEEPDEDWCVTVEPGTPCASGPRGRAETTTREASEPRVHRLALQGEHAEDAFVDPPQRLPPHEPLSPSTPRANSPAPATASSPGHGTRAGRGSPRSCSPGRR